VLGRAIGETAADPVAAGTAARLYLHDAAGDLFTKLGIHAGCLSNRWEYRQQRRGDGEKDG
jgi:hypothetical protein